MSRKPVVFLMSSDAREIVKFSAITRWKSAASTGDSVNNRISLFFMLLVLLI